MPVTHNTFRFAEPSKTTPVANPTWYCEIRYMFTDVDLAHMASQGLDLTNYDAVVASASAIYGQVSMGSMPPNAPWPAAWTQTFLNWMIAKFPMGTAPLPPAAVTAMSLAIGTTASRVRRDINTLSAAEVDTLSKAFAGIMAKGQNDPNSYVVQAGLHWLPPPLYCLHHVPAYNPWHRAYLFSFENALRSVPGCEGVTLPYWDITTPFPDALKIPPFDKYTVPVDIGGGFNAGYTTQRVPYADIQADLVASGVADDISRAMSKTSWEDFHGLIAGSANNTIISAHDSGHVVTTHPSAAA